MILDVLLIWYAAKKSNQSRCAPSMKVMDFVLVENFVLIEKIFHNC